MLPSLIFKLINLKKIYTKIYAANERVDWTTTLTFGKYEIELKILASKKQSN